jgi:putative transposase
LLLENSASKVEKIERLRLFIFRRLFVTVCTKDKECILGDMKHETMRLNRAGELICQVWFELPKRCRDIDLDAFVVMPNHIHGIIVLSETSVAGVGLALSGGKGAASSAPTLGDVIRTFKSISAIRVNRGNVSGFVTEGQP